MGINKTNQITTQGVRQAPIVWQDFGLVLLVAVALLALILTSDLWWPLRPLRIVLGLAFLLFGPGYCLTAALFPRGDDLQPIERLGLSTGLSVALVSLLALLANWLPWGIQLWPVVVVEYGSAAMFGLVALWRRARLHEWEQYRPKLPQPPWAWRSPLGHLERRLYVLVAAAVVLAALTTAWVFLSPAPDEFMTEFYMVGPDGLAEHFPYEVRSDENVTLSVGVVNREEQAHSYRLELWAIDSYNPERRQQVAQEPPFTLLPGEERQWPLAWRMPWAGDDQQVELLLYSDADPLPYCRLLLWLDVHEPS
jgi:uncharacterized membrane protein